MLENFENMEKYRAQMLIEVVTPGEPFLALRASEWAFHSVGTEMAF